MKSSTSPPSAVRIIYPTEKTTRENRTSVRRTPTTGFVTSDEIAAMAANFVNSHHTT